jgi:predicted nucleotidyltransferase
MGDHLDDLRQKLRAQLPVLRERYGVQWLGVFGSFARGEQHGESDLDLLVEFDDRPLSLFQFIALEDELSDALGVKVDLVEKSALKPAIGRHVLAEVVPV